MRGCLSLRESGSRGDPSAGTVVLRETLVDHNPSAGRSCREARGARPARIRVRRLDGNREADRERAADDRGKAWRTPNGMSPDSRDETIVGRPGFRGRQAEEVWVRGLSWLEANPAVFEVPEGRPGRDHLPAIKAAGELGRLAEVLLRRRDLPAAVRGHVRTLLFRAWAAFREGRLFAELLEDRPELLIVASLYAPFHRSGLMHRRTASLLGGHSTRPDSDARGLRRCRVPAEVDSKRGRRRPQVRYAEDAPAIVALALADAHRVLGRPERSSVPDLLARTLLGRLVVRTPDPAFVSSVAHAAYFATDFGARPREIPEQGRMYLRRQGPGWIATCRSRGDLDACAQLGLALACAGEEPAAAGVEAILHEAQLPDGSIPGSPALAYHATVTGVLASFALTVGLARQPGA